MARLTSENYDIREIEILRRKGHKLREIRFELGYDYEKMRHWLIRNFTWNMATGRYERKLKKGH